MILKSLFELIFAFNKLIFTPIPSIPDIPIFSDILEFFNNVLSEGFGILCFFIKPSTLIFGLNFFLVIFSFRYLYYFVLWILQKIPFLNLK